MPRTTPPFMRSQLRRADKHSASKIKHNLLLQPILARRERVERHEEVGKLAAAAERVLNAKQT